jgi:hypothetical protein
MFNRNRRSSGLKDIFFTNNRQDLRPYRPMPDIIEVVLCAPARVPTAWVNIQAALRRAERCEDARRVRSSAPPHESVFGDGNWKNLYGAFLYNTELRTAVLKLF